MPSVWHEVLARQQNVTLQNTCIFTNTALQHADVFMCVSVVMPSQGTEPEPHTSRLSDSEWIDMPRSLPLATDYRQIHRRVKSCSSPLSQNHGQINLKKGLQKYQLQNFVPWLDVLSIMATNLIRNTDSCNTSSSHVSCLVYNTYCWSS